MPESLPNGPGHFLKGWLYSMYRAFFYDDIYLILLSSSSLCV